MDIYSNFSVTDGNNNNTPPDGWPENMDYAAVNNTGRALMGAIKRWQVAAFSGTLNTGGSSTAYTLTSGQSLSGYSAGLMLTFEAHATSTGLVTLNVDGLGARQVHNAQGVQLNTQGFVAGSHYTVIYDGTQFKQIAGERTEAEIIATGSFPAAAVQTVLNIPRYFAYLSLNITGASNVNAANTLRVRASDDNGVSFAVATYLGHRFEAAAAVAAVTIGIHDGGANTLASDTHLASIMLMNYREGSRQLCIANSVASGASRSSIVRVSGIGSINALEIGWTGAGNFDAGTFSLQGHR